ncbi:beta-ketoacyl-ACP synthase III [Bacteroidales bacterium AH-315-I05]|nr:beta-ketoacyl-ACP synthase III [Bacteroidales bacterium AH-315-I05]
MLNETYITRLAKSLPNRAVVNDEMETFLGLVGNEPSRTKRIILRNNGIQTRYYAINKKGQSTHTNSELTAEAINLLFDEEFSLNDMELLCCGTTSADQVLPSHASMVHGELGGNPVEIISPSGACCAGMNAMKYAYLSVLSGTKNNGICTGSEKLSNWMLSEKFETEAQKLTKLNGNPIISFEKEFLRWMLSDGAGAALLQNKPNESGISLRIEWIDLCSFANELETCMYAGCEKTEEGKIVGWKDVKSNDWLEQSIFSMKQDVKVLDENIVLYGGKTLKEIVERRNIDLDSIAHFLPHLSSEYFRGKIAEEMQKQGIAIPQEKWFTNLTRVGNVGSASVYFMLEELYNSGKLQKGEKILLMVPESARFSYAYSLMTVV